MHEPLRVLLTLALALALAVLAGCAGLPEGRKVIDDVSVIGAQKLDSSDVAGKLATSPSPKFLGLFRGVVYDYELFDPNTLQRDLARVERYYRARGYYAVKVRAGRVFSTASNHVRVEVAVEEGPVTLTKSIKVEGLAGVPPAVALEVGEASGRKLKAGEAFDEDLFKAAQNDVKRALTDNGYAYAKVKPDAFVDIVHEQAHVVFVVTPGPRATFGWITIVGLDPDGAGPAPQEIPEKPLRHAMNINAGEPYSTAVLDSATQALLDLEVFSSVEIVPNLPEPPPAEPVIALTVKVEPTRLRQLRLGGGLEFDQIKTDLHLLIGWEDHNLLGGLRDFTVDFQPGAVLYPTRINSIIAPTDIFPEERLRFQLKQPGFIESRTNVFVRPELNTFPLLVQTNPDANAPVVGYVEVKSAAGIDRTFGKLYASLSYNVQVENPFTYKGLPDPLLSTLVISYPELVTQLDFRNNRLHPHSGFYLGNIFQVAGGIFGGNAVDVKLQPEIRTYIPVGRKLTFVTRASAGMLFASSYGAYVKSPPPPGHTLTAADILDVQEDLFRGLFSGGPNSNRGFPIRGISPHGVIPFLNPTTASQQVALNCVPSANNIPDPTLCSVPIGGFTLWELSNELRFPIAGPLSAAIFCDMGDVSPQQGNYRFDHLHLSCGAGVRYDTPVGPIRLDIGYRIQPLQVLGYRSESAVYNANNQEGLQPTILGIPAAIAFGIGEAY